MHATILLFHTESKVLVVPLRNRCSPTLEESSRQLKGKNQRTLWMAAHY